MFSLLSTVVGSDKDRKGGLDAKAETISCESQFEAATSLRRGAGRGFCDSLHSAEELAERENCGGGGGGGGGGGAGRGAFIGLFTESKDVVLSSDPLEMEVDFLS